MATLGSAEESLRLAEHYRGLTDEELIALAQQKDKLTELAQQALAMEIWSRKLTFPPAEPQASQRPALPPDTGEECDPYPEEPAEETADEGDPYAEDRKLLEISRVWSEADARRLQYVLDVAGIPFYMGREKATGVDDVRSRFDDGLPVKVMSIALPWAYEALARNYFPQDEPPEENVDAGDFAIQCPRCRTTEVVFHELVDRAPGARPKYRWTCGSCGYEWEDDGMVIEN
jgi:DNA-directed RNA polymerase subunit M/transcription elongation factor TFIIS